MGRGLAPFPSQRRGKLSESDGSGSAFRSGCTFSSACSGCPVCVDYDIRVACKPRTRHESGARVLHRRAGRACVHDRHVRPSFSAVLLLSAWPRARSYDDHVLEESGRVGGVLLWTWRTPLADGATAGAWSRRPDIIHAVRCGVQARHMVWIVPFLVNYRAARSTAETHPAQDFGGRFRQIVSRAFGAEGHGRAGFSRPDSRESVRFPYCGAARKSRLSWLVCFQAQTGCLRYMRAHWCRCQR
jgi:hypothetical protein